MLIKCDVCQCETPESKLTNLLGDMVCLRPLCYHDWACATYEVLPEITAGGRADLIAQGHTEGGYPDED